MLSLLRITFWIWFGCVGGVIGEDIYVAVFGEDRPGCGSTIHTPCYTLGSAVGEAMSGDTIFIDGKGSDVHDTWLCREEPVKINFTLTISGIKTTPIVGCHLGENRQLLFEIDSLAGERTMVTFGGLVLHNVAFNVDNSSIVYQQCEIIDSNFASQMKSALNEFFFYDSTWQGHGEENCTAQCKIEGALNIYGVVLNVVIHNSTFWNTLLTITAANSVPSMIVTESKFSILPNTKTVHGGIYLTIMKCSELSVVNVSNSLFENQFHAHPISSIMNLYHAALLVRTSDPTKAKEDVNTLSEVSVTNCTFLNNERGLTFLGPFRTAYVRDCYFEGNIAMHAGAAILYLTHIETQSFIDNSIFHTNAAGSYNPEKVQDFSDAFQISGDEVRIHSICCKGVISFVGKGGAIRIQRGNLTLNDCTFTNNTARLLGGAIFVDRESIMHVSRTAFENTPIHRHAMQGDVFYSNGQVTISSATLLIHTAANHVAMVRHSGDHWSIQVSDIGIQCPVGYRLRVTNTSAYGVSEFGLRRSYKLDQLSYFCESCPRNKYSLDHGYLNYSLEYSEFAYYTLLVNGDTPQPAYSGTYQYHDIECQQCPYGGRCQQGITAVPNFWGYIQGNQVRFQHCPKGYCCSNTNCKGYSDCALHRTGVLCGSCDANFSEALFSSACIEDSRCDPTWLWPMALCSGFLYALFLLFQKDIRDLMFFNPVGITDIKCCCKKTSNYLENHENQEENNVHCLLNNKQVELDSFQQDVDTEIEKPNVNNNQKLGRCLEDTDDKPEEVAVDTGASFLIILFYYFQDAQLLNIKTVFAKAENKNIHLLKEILSGLFKFRVELFQFMDKVCFISGMTPTSKLLVTTLLVPYVLVQFGTMYIIYKWIRQLRKAHHRGQDHTEPKPFLCKLATGFVLSLLFTYQKLATTSFTLLNCVPVGDDSVLFIEGHITCYQPWQYGVMAYAASCIVPFCLTILIGPGLLKDNMISLKQFFCACLVPLPFLTYWLALRLYLWGRRPEKSRDLAPEAQSVISILQGPFKDSESKLFGPTCGAGILVGRRLVLILLFTFVNDTLIRMLCMMLLCFVMLLHHVHVLPYKDTRGNIAGTASSAALLIVGGINLVRAGFEAAEYIPQGPNALLMHIFEWLENTLMLYMPACVMGVVIVLATVKIVVSFLKCALGVEESSSTPPSPNTQLTAL